MCNVKSANISTRYKTDHSLIKIKIALHSNMRGPGFWILNTSFLTEIDYVNQIRTVIKDTEEEYKNDRSVNDALDQAKNKRTFFKIFSNKKCKNITS